MIRLIPTPRYTDMGDARVAVAPYYTADAPLTDAARTLADYARRTHGITLTEGVGGICLMADATLPAESYALTVTAEGGMLLAWGDHIKRKFPVLSEGIRKEQQLVEERVPPFAENIWNREKPTDWNEFRERMTAVTSLFESFYNNK